MFSYEAQCGRNGGSVSYRFEMLLYERTITYFEGEMEQSPQTERWQPR